MTDAIGRNPEAEKLPAYPLFDWLRFVLASVVVLTHAGLPILPGTSGGLAVDVFLSLSGWLIGGILLRTKRAELPRFFFNRSTRIWLPYAAAMVFLYGVAALREGMTPFWWKYLFYDSTFTHQLFTIFPQATHELPLKGSGNQFWSISVEEQFYLFAPLVMFLLRFGKHLLTWLAVAAVALLLAAPAAPIAFGVIAAIVQRDHGDWHLRPAARIVLLILSVGSLVTMELAGLHVVLRSLLGVSTVLLLATPGQRRAVPVFLGAISYPVYLNHWFGMFIAHGLAHHVGAISGAVLSLTGYLAGVAVGTVAWLLVDRPVMRLREGWYTPRLGRRLAIAAYALVTVGVAGGLMIARS